MARGTIQNREAFLDHIAKRMGRERRPEQIQRPDWKYQPQKQVYEDLSQDELVGVLKDICGAIHADVKVTREESLQEVLEEAVRAYGGGPIVTSDDLRFLGLGLGSFLGREDVHVWDPSRGKENIDIAEKANIGITFSDITLAESGTVVLFSANFILLRSSSSSRKIRKSLRKSVD
jgi:L-lactate dehydrogenase complex protein LldG